MKVKVVCRKVYDYIRYDLREIAFPSSLPDPPHIQKRPKLTWRDNLFKATKLYCASWVRDIGPDLRPNDYAKDNEANGEAKTTSSAQEKEPSVVEDLGQFYSLSLSNWGIYGSVFNLLFKWNGFGSNHILSRSGSKIWMKQATFHIEGSYSACAPLVFGAVAARGGMETLRPALQRVYMTRASAYRDALKSFIQGYQEGVQQAYSILVSAHLYKGLYMGKRFFFSIRLSIVIAAVIISASVVAGSTWYGSATDLGYGFFSSAHLKWNRGHVLQEIYRRVDVGSADNVEGGELDVDPRTLKAKA
ncbi:hypothetical protein POTOM_052710 [Populus tomentosa]|uniref:Uncharacterized protein n=1 Tax=Populus tomentosa TaxID=118781 RepID=A0A8X8C0J3_POPTO|nr:hypothetical protein POTOM_052710 [Populus tomentosa]